MNKLTRVALVGVLTALLIGCGRSGEGPVKEGHGTLEGTVYGKGVETAETTTLTELYAKIDEYEGKRVRVEGVVIDVCVKRGCWFKMAGGENADLIFKVTDGVIVFPMSMKGKYAVADGVAKKVEMTLEQTRDYVAHLAEEKGEEFDPESVTEPMSFVRLDGVGAVVRDHE